MKYLLMISVLFITAFPVYSKIDTLRHYDPKTVGGTRYSYGTIVEQLARFDLPRPAHIKEIIAKLSGNKGEKLTLHLYGHEAGTIYIQLFKDIIPPVVLTKTIDGVQTFRVNIASKNDLKKNNQFF
ncbi:MAG: hypothetical protein HQK83_15075, partial [Fibrobacteria bacterium]|nr:hypothetical protein [Fibrobacteria bacterium]